MNDKQGYMTSFAVDKSFIVAERWDIVDSAVRLMMDTLYEDGVLNKKCKKVKVGYIEMKKRDANDRFVTRIMFE